MLLNVSVFRSFGTAGGTPYRRPPTPELSSRELSTGRDIRSAEMDPQSGAQRLELRCGHLRSFISGIDLVPRNEIGCAAEPYEDMLMKVRHRTACYHGEHELWVECTFHGTRSAPDRSRDCHRLVLGEGRQMWNVSSSFDEEIPGSGQPRSRYRAMSNDHLVVAMDHRTRERSNTPMLLTDRADRWVRTVTHHGSRPPARCGR